MSIKVERAIESGRSCPSDVLPSPDEYLLLVGRMEEEARLEQARRQAHARVWELAKQQGVKPIRSIEDLYGDFWPEEESIDEFLEWLRELRHSDKPRRLPE
jgi:hypothetical protein